MNQKSITLLAVLMTLALTACNRHKNSEPAPAPEQPPAQGEAAVVPEPPPQVNEPPPVVKKDTATQRLFSGSLQAMTAQPVHGVVALMKSEDGYAIRIEHLRIDGAMPEIDVVLSTQESVSSASALGAGVVALGEIKGATGNMNYPLSAGIDPGNYHTVVLLLHGKNQVFATASLGLM